METFGNIFLTKMQGTFYDKVAQGLQDRYLKEDSLDDIDQIINDVKKCAKKATGREKGVLRTIKAHDEMDRAMHWKVVIEKEGREMAANELPLTEVFAYPMEEVSDDVDWFVDVIWNLTLGNDDDDEHLLSANISDELSSDLPIGQGNQEISDHTYNDDDEDEGQMNWHEPEENL